MIDLNYRHIMKILDLLEDQLIRLGDSSSSSHKSPIEKMHEYNNNGDDFVSTVVSAPDQIVTERELIREIRDRFMQEINKISFSFSLEQRGIEKKDEPKSIIK